MRVAPVAQVEPLHRVLGRVAVLLVQQDELLLRAHRQVLHLLLDLRMRNSDNIGGVSVTALAAKAISWFKMLLVTP